MSVITEIRAVISTIWTEALPKSGYEAVSGPTLEKYGRKFEPNTGLGGLEIWIAVKQMKESKVKNRSKTKDMETCCPLTSHPRLRLATNAQTAAIKDNFPSGVAQPALRALVAAGFTTLDQLAQVTEEQLAELHGMGPKAIKTLRAGLNEKGLDLKKNHQGKYDLPKPSGTTNIDDYISQFPDDVRGVLEKVRETIRNAAPDAKEVIRYQMPAFKQHGILVYFAARKQHIGLYPPISGDKALEKAVARCAGPKGNLQFPLDEPMPLKLIERIVKLRVKQDLAKSEAKGTKRK